MKIETSTFTGASVRTGSAPAKSGTASRSGDAVNLSAASTAASGPQEPPVNAVKIQEIKDAIAQGRFQINPEAIADGLLETARDLVNSQRKA